MATSALAGSMPRAFTASRTFSKLSGGQMISHTLPSSFMSSAPASNAALRSASSSILAFSTTSCPLRWNIHATLFSAARLPAYFVNVWRISPTVRFLLSVRVCTSSATPPGP